MEPRSRRYLLVVDDDVDALERTTDELTLLGYEVTTAVDGPSALAIAKVLRPDCALLDISLPGMDGYELARALRQQPGWREVTLLAIVECDGLLDLDAAEASGFAAHLRKPVSLELLRDLLCDGLPLDAVRE